MTEIFVGMTQDEFVKIWHQEAVTILQSRAKGIQIDAYKVLAERKVRKILKFLKLV